jgi:curved DNA-binding protein CbpA
MPRNKENFYEVLKVDRRATIAEIVAAYHSARAAFARDSVATYSLFSPDDTQRILAKLDEAYHVLSNVERKRDYDERLDADGGAEPFNEPTTPEPRGKAAKSEPETADAPPSAASAPPPSVETPAGGPEVVNGAILKSIREQRQLSIEDVSRITKIPSKFVLAIEQEKIETLPARVYLQGFVKNLATLYRLDPRKTVEAYLKSVETPPPAEVAPPTTETA